MRVMITGGSGFIGTNLVDYLRRGGVEVLNCDSQPPLDAGQSKYWKNLDICDRESVIRAVSDFAPSHIVHLAALATFEATKAELDAVNVVGTVNLLDAVLEHAPQSRILITSTQYVNGPGTSFDDDWLFHTVNDYGQSKADAEAATRSAKYESLDWIITRPTNIWGAFHPRFPIEIWKYIRRGVYLHPGHKPIVRAYGYVGNICRQMDILLRAPADYVRHRVFYLTDAPIDSYEFLNEFSRALRGRALPRVPYAILKFLALVGDGVQAVGLKSPFRSDRLHRMTTSHSARFESMWDQFGYRPLNLSDAVAETKNWLKQSYPEYYR
jgi:GlcNAc-P-P-Und epimerase